MKNLLLIAFFAIINLIQAQNQTFVVEEKLGKFKTFNKYNLNDFTKSFLENEGFTVYNENELPEEISNNRCSAYYVNYEDDSNLFNTILKMTIKDCTGKLIFETDFFKTREKEYRVAYREVFRNIAKDFQRKKNTIQYTNLQATKTENQSIVIASDIPAELGLLFSFKDNTQEGEIKTQTGKTLFKITKTSIDNLYMASNNYTDGIVYLKNGDWYFEFTKNGEKIIEKIE